jgi:hypothetical protein
MYALTRARSPRTTIALPSGRFLLGAISPADATEQIFPQARVTSAAGHNLSIRNQILASAGAGQILNVSGAPAYMPGTADCAGVSLAKPALMSATTGLALKFLPQAAAAGGPIGAAVVIAIAGISELFSVIFGHHAKAVAKERSVLCAAVPAANQSIELIAQAVSGGQATPAQAIAALDQVVSGFQSAVSSIIHGADPMSSGECNAACVILSELRAIVLVAKSQYQDLVAQQLTASSSSASAAIANVFSGGSGSSLLPWAAAGLGLWLILKE